MSSKTLYSVCVCVFREGGKGNTVCSVYVVYVCDNTGHTTRHYWT